MYMEIPEITASQLEVMQKICFDPEMSVFSQCSVKPTDPLKEAAEAVQAMKDSEYLCTLGFLREITADHKERIDRLAKDTDRNWRVFQVTAMGRAMFGITTSSVPN